jgi:hypothetical protein
LIRGTALASAPPAAISGVHVDAHGGGPGTPVVTANVRVEVSPLDVCWPRVSAAAMRFPFARSTAFLNEDIFAISALV